jgi:hypothetical protein
VRGVTASAPIVLLNSGGLDDRVFERHIVRRHKMGNTAMMHTLECDLGRTAGR